MPSPCKAAAPCLEDHHPREGTPRVKRPLQPASPVTPSCPQHVTTLVLSQAAAGAASGCGTHGRGHHPTPTAGPREQQQDLESHWDPIGSFVGCPRLPPAPHTPSTKCCRFHPRQSECAGVAPWPSLAREYSNVARNGVTGRFNLVHRPSRARKVRREVLNIL